MTEVQARKYLETVMICIQKARSNAALALPEYRNILPDINKWLYGDKCLLPALEKILDGKIIEPMVFYNIMFIVYKFIPELQGVAILLQFDEFPDPDVSWVRKGWDR